MAAGNGQQDGPIVTFTESAREQLLQILDRQELRGKAAVRIGIRGRRHDGFDYAMGLEEGSPGPQDTVIEEDDFKLFIETDILPKLRGTTVDFVDQVMGGGFRIDNPNPVWDDPTLQGLQQLIDEEINPGVAMHGGNVQLIDFKDGTVYVQFAGGCQGCGMVDVTLRQGIERLMKQSFPFVQSVVDTTDHAGGTNPYYQPAKGAPEGAASPFHQPSKG